ncbi:MAG: FAD/NAD(P)-binding protein [Actinophytocola sp.]|uniref:FAD/NAD(P)-binding protein n=1 Tax=Actinophytocola sp. TaxID=1872138 RepID=UPI003D6AF277
MRRVAVVGSGPRGLIVVERLAARLAEEDSGRPIEINLIDAVEVGAGRIYRTDQPDWFLMNTVAGMVSAFSGVPDEGPTRAGSGPSLYEWWRERDPENASPDGYAPRAEYGRYTRFLLDAVEANLPDHVLLVRRRAYVDDVTRAGDGYRLTLSTGEAFLADQVVLTTGHSTVEPVGRELELAEFAVGRPGLRYLGGESPADMPLDDIPPDTPVGVIGLGLSFYDVMAALTLGRGGKFDTTDDGGLRYIPSGTEPLIIAGSRSGMPVPARGRNQKPPRHAYRPRLFTPGNIRSATPTGPLDFLADVYPWLISEVNLVYYATLLRRDASTAAAEEFVAAVTRAAEGAVVPDVAAVAAAHGLAGVPPLDLDELALPFAGRTFADRTEFDEALRTAVTKDLAESANGNVDSPLKAALDVLRDCRGPIMKMADFSGFNPISHRRDFVGWYAARCAFLAAGPPSVRLRQVLALLESGVLRIIGPRAVFRPDRLARRFSVCSPQVPGAHEHVDVVVDARVPDPNLARDRSSLTRRLRERGIWTGYVNGEGPESFATGGVAVTTSPYHPIGRGGEPDEGLYVVGIPTEHTRWFMQVGSNRPGMWGDFVHDGDAIAAHVLKEGG